MDEKAAKKIVDYTFKDVFGRDNPFTLEQIKEKFAFDILLPVKAKDTFTGKDAWIMKKIGNKVKVWEEWGKTPPGGDPTMPKEKIKDMDDLLGHFNNIFYTIADKAWEAKDYSETDNIYLASEIYHCSKVIRTQKAAFSAEINDSKYGVACYYIYNCTSVIRAFDSSYCTACFNVAWSEKSSRCMYLNNCTDMFESMFCANLRSRKHCICNMQFEKEEYAKVKEMVVDWTLENFGKGNSIGL